MKKIFVPIFLILSFSAHADRFYVNASASAGGDGSSWASAFNYLQNALDQTVAGRGDEVWIAAGTYYPDDGANVTEGDREASFTIVEGVTLYGGFSGDESDVTQRDWETNRSILSGDIFSQPEFQSLHVCQVYGKATLDGLTITKGNDNSASGKGGGIICHLGKTILLNCIVENNSAASFGGGVLIQPEAYVIAEGSIFRNNDAGTFSGGAIQANNDYRGDQNIFKFCEFSENSAGRLGGAYSGRSRSSKFISCTFESNSVGQDSGGAVSSTGDTFIRCVFLNNKARNSGGAIHTSEDFIQSCLFSKNEASLGGAISCNGSSVITNSVLFENTASGSGGAIYTYSSNNKIINSTFYGNSSSSGASAINDRIDTRKNYILSSVFWGNYNSRDLENTITITGEFNNTTDVIPTPNSLRAMNLVEGGESAVASEFNFFQGNILSGDPLFVDPTNPIGPDGIWGTADDGFRLQESSPAIGQGNSLFLPEDTNDLDKDGLTEETIPLDIAGFLRIQDGSLDLGAYEFGDSMAVLYSLTVNSSQGGTVEPSGSESYAENSVIPVLASTSAGYVFGDWTGDISSTENPLEVTMTGNLTITANFTPDLNDPDEDGLSNFDEIVTYSTNPDLSDTDKDGIDDGYEVAGLLDPLVDNTATIQMFQNNPEYLPELFTPDQVVGVNFDGLAVGIGFDGKFRMRFGVKVTEDFTTWLTRPIEEGDVYLNDGEIELEFSPSGQTDTFFKAVGTNHE